MEPPIDISTIKGWGIDADPENEPTYPLRRRLAAERAGLSWTRPASQPANLEVLHSNERPTLTSVFGTSVPPGGLSGLLRRAAFRFSESNYGHWLPLMLADRIGVFEGILSDITHGHVPNFVAERGWKADWKHARGRLLTRLAVGSVVVGALLAVIARISDRKLR